MKIRRPWFAVWRHFRRGVIVFNKIGGAGGGRHEGQPVLRAGKELPEARAAMVMVHGRGASAGDILMLAQELPHPDFVFLAPQAAGNSWYPHSFLMPIDSNEPGISSGMATIAAILAQLEQAGIAAEQTILLGFSQGACLATEFAARNARRYGGIVGLSGGLIGPPGTPRNYSGSLAQTPVFLGCSDVDPHIPKERVEETAAVYGRMDAGVTTRLYPGMGHTIIQDEIDFIREMMAGF
jgi:phospholipase/carboxylesterase